MTEYSDLPQALVKTNREGTGTGLTRVETGGNSRTEEEEADIEIIVTIEVGGMVVTRADRAGTFTLPLPATGVNRGKGGTEMSTQAIMGIVVGRTLEGTDISL